MTVAQANGPHLHPPEGRGSKNRQRESRHPAGERPGHRERRRPRQRPVGSKTKAEQETVIRWDQEERIAHLWTAYSADARRWQRLGYPVQVRSRTQDRTPRTWAAEVPIDAIRFRPVRDGQVVKRKGHRKGRVSGRPDGQLVASEAERSVAMAEG
jgi:hypothetical protein